MIQPSAFRLLPADLPGSRRRTRCPAASYTTPGDTIQWIALEPGYTVHMNETETVIEYNGVRWLQ